MILSCLFLIFLPVKVHAQGNYLWLYSIDPLIEEEDFLSQINFLLENEEHFVVLIDISESYKKRILYLLGNIQKENDFLVAVSNTPKYDSMFIKNELFQYFEVNMIFAQDEEELWFLSDTYKKYNIRYADDEISQTIDTINADENFVYIARSSFWNEGNISNITEYIKSRNIGTKESIEKVKLVMLSQADTLKWFNTLGKFIMSFYMIVIVVFVIIITVFRTWSKRRIRKREGG